MPARAGELRDRIAIQAKSNAEGDSGTPLEVYATIAGGDRWAKMEALSGREYFAAQERHGEVTHKATIRYFEPVTSGMRIVYRDAWFDIISPPIHSWDRSKTVLMCKLLEGKPL